MTAPTRYYAATMSRADLNASVAMLRARHAAILNAHRLLLEYGVVTQSPEVADRLAAVKAEAHEIACRLAHLGYDQDASAADGGWLVTPGCKECRS